MARHPGGRTCSGALPLALLLLPWAMWKEARYQRSMRKKG